ncbi:MAG: hypothetical protein WEB19_02475 [Acidimicrobiia bacterium]
MADGRRDAVVLAGAAVAAARIGRRGWSAKVVSRVASTALRRGVRSGSRGWLYLGAGASALQVLQRFFGAKEEVFTLKLRPGDTFEIRHLPRPSKRR